MEYLWSNAYREIVEHKSSFPCVTHISFFRLHDMHDFL